jgi:hypothetical protein
MRSLSFTLILTSALLMVAGCKRGHRPPETASTIYAGDPDYAKFFSDGFYNIEANAWRWTDKQFSVTLNPPPDSTVRGGRLVLHLVVPAPVIQHSQFLELSCSIEGLKLDPQVFAKEGAYTYERDVPADKLRGHEVRIDFAVDHALPPTTVDSRQLGIIVNKVELEAK